VSRISSITSINGKNIILLVYGIRTEMAPDTIEWYRN